MLLYCFAPLRFSLSPCILPCVFPLLHWAKYVFLKILTFVKSFIDKHLQMANKNILKIYVKKIVSLKIFCNFTAENETKNINLKI